MQLQSIPISGEILKAKAEELSRELPSTSTKSWTCSSGWLSRWKTRHNRRVCGENAAVDKEVCEDWKERKLKPVLKKYDPRNVFSADETGLYWRLLPDKSHAVAGEVCTGGKKSKERVTVLICANMDGSEKVPLLTIGKYKKPRCFRGVPSLPTEYQANPSVWMNSTMFEEWSRKWDARLTSHNRKIALFLDNCTAHPHIKNLLSIELFFLPPNTTSEMQPCDQGIIQAFKVHYRKIEPEVDEEDPFMDLEEETACQDDDPMQQLQLTNRCSFDEYVAADDGVQCSPMPTIQDIVSSVTQISEEGETDDVGDPLPSCYLQTRILCFPRPPVLSVMFSGKGFRESLHTFKQCGE